MECYKSDGICIFCLPSRKQAKEIIKKIIISGYKTHSEVRVHVKTDMFLQNSLVIENMRISRQKLLEEFFFFFNSCI